jgi:glycosyltransferase involved in cell wall biosynthesis
MQKTKKHLGKDLVTVIVPAYNAGKFLVKAVESILAQTHTNLEIILINDGSTDNTLEIMKRYKSIDKRVVIDSHENLGMGDSLNRALLLATGSLVARMDADDIMLPVRIEKQLAFMKSNKNVAVASCLAYYINEADQIIGKTFSDIRTVDDSKRYFILNQAIGILHPGVIYRKEIILKVCGYRGIFWPADDIDLWNRLIEKKHHIVVMQEILMKYRICGSSVITSGFLRSRLKFEWVRDCMYKRRSGQSEISFEKFLEDQTRQSIVTRANRARKNLAKFYYRSAGFEYASKKWISFFFKLITAFFLQPLYVLKKLKRQKL